MVKEVYSSQLYHFYHCHSYYLNYHCLHFLNSIFYLSYFYRSPLLPNSAKISCLGANYGNGQESVKKEKSKEGKPAIKKAKKQKCIKKVEKQQNYKLIYS